MYNSTEYFTKKKEIQEINKKKKKMQVIMYQFSEYLMKLMANKENERAIQNER